MKKKDGKNTYVTGLPHVVEFMMEFSLHSASTHPNIIRCQFSPVKHLRGG